MRGAGLAIGLCGTLAATAAGQTSFVASSGEWDVGENWSNGVPTSSLQASVDNGGTVTLSNTAGRFVSGLTVGESGTGTLTMTGGTLGNSGTLSVGGGNGTMAVSGGSVSTGSLDIRQNGLLTISGSASVTSGSTTIGVGTEVGTVTVAGGIFSAGAVSLGGSSTLNLNGGVLAASQIAMTGVAPTLNFNGGTLRATASTALLSSTAGSVNIGSQGAIIDTQSHIVTLSGTVLQGTGGLTKTGAGTLTLPAGSSYTGGTTLQSGTVIVTSLADGGATSSLGASSNAAANLVLEGGTTLRYTGGAASTDRLFQIGSVGGVVKLDSSGTGPIAFTNPGSITFSSPNQSRSLWLTANHMEVNTFASVLGNNGSGVTAVTVYGGNWMFTGANTYTGNTFISGGILSLSGAGTLGGSTAIITSVGGTLDLGGKTIITGRGAFSTSGIAKNGTLSSSANFVVEGDSRDMGGVVFAGTGGLDFSGSSATAVITLNGGNTYTGVTTITAGILSVGTLANGGVASGIGAATSAAANLTLSNNATLRYTGAAQSSDRAFQIGSTGATLNASGTGALNLTATGAIGFTAGTTHLLTLRGTNTGANTLAALIPNNGGSATSITKTDAGTWCLTGANTYTGGTNIGGGTLSVTSLANAGSPSNIGSAAATASNLRISGGTLQYTGSGSTTNRLFQIGSSAVLNTGTIDASGTGALVFTSTGALTFGGTSGQLRGLVLTGTNTDTNTLRPNLGNNAAGLVSLTKNGSGTWSVTGVNTYTGGTTINAGTLLANNASGSAFGTGAVGVASGATLGGGGSIGGLTTIASGGHIAPGNSAGTLTFTNGLTLAAGSVLDFEVGSTGDLIVVSGGTLGGPASGTITLNLSDFGDFSAGTYTLIDYVTAAGTQNFAADKFSLGTTIPGFTYNLGLNGSSLELTATAVPEPATYATLLGAAALGFAVRRKRRPQCR